MNRSNLGNQVANGMQVLSVGAFTGGNWKGQQKQRRLADASSALNNMTDDEIGQVGRMRADQMREQVRQHQNKIDGVSNLSDEEQQSYGDMRADQMREQVRQHQNKIDGMSHLSDKEQQSYGDKRADDLRKYINGDEEAEENQSVDELVSGISSMNTPQSEALAKSINTNSEYLRKRNVGKDPKTGWFVSLNTKKEGDK